MNEEKTTNITSEQRRKNGIYFTPKEIVINLLNHLKDFDFSNKKILEPSVGKGVFIEEILKTWKNTDITAYEIDESLYSFTKKSFSSINIINSDFLNSPLNEKYDLIIGNPPFYVLKTDIYKSYYIGRPNIFILFIIHSLLKLNKNGILCFILPQTFLNCKYYFNTRKFINENYEILNMFENTDKFEFTKYKTFTIIIRNNPCNIEKNQQYIYNDIFTMKKYKLEKILKNDHYYLSEIGDINIYIGKFVWNQNKELLCDDTTKPVLIYRPNSSRISYINENEKTNNLITTKNIIIINRGFGKNVYSFEFELIDKNKFPNGFIIENHNIVIESEDTEKIYKSLQNENTRKFIEYYTTNGALNLNDLKYNIPLFT